MRGHRIVLAEDQVAILGTDTDLAIGRRLGISETATGNHRRAHGIPAFRPYAPLRGADLDRPTADLCLAFGVTVAGVARARSRAGSAPPRKLRSVAPPRRTPPPPKPVRPPRTAPPPAPIRSDDDAAETFAVPRFNPDREPDAAFVRRMERM